MSQQKVEQYRAWCQYKYKKNHFIHSHLDSFPETCGDVSDEQGKRFYQDIKVMGKKIKDVGIRK